MVKIINKEEMWKVLYSDLDYLRLSAESFDSDRLFDFAKDLLVKLIKVENKEFVMSLKFIEALLNRAIPNIPEVLEQIDDMILHYEGE